jgi:hypothetical protein
MIDFVEYSGSVLKLCVDLARYVRRIEGVDSTKAVFEKEFANLQSVLESIEESARNMGVHILATQTGQRHWKNVETALEDCKTTLEALVLLVRPKHTVMTWGGFLGRARDQIILDWNSEEISLLQRQLVSCRQMMEVSFQMITL